jgi:site-specific recombinase XerD
MHNTGDNALHPSLRTVLLPLIESFMEATDYAAASRRAVRSDLIKFGKWFVAANSEAFDLSRITTRDCADFRDSLRRERGQSVATVNRNLVSLRRFFGWLKDKGHVQLSPVGGVKELRRQESVPKSLDRAAIRKLLREAEARCDVRAVCIFSMLLYCGLRGSELVALEERDLELGDRSGWLTVRNGKGNKQRRVPIPLPARRSLESYCQTRGDLSLPLVFLGERGPLTAKGVRALFSKYSAITGVKVHPHLLRHCFGRQFLEANQNDLVALAALMGHESLDTTRRYVQRTPEQLEVASERMGF